MVKTRKTNVRKHLRTTKKKGRVPVRQHNRHVKQKQKMKNYGAAPRKLTKKAAKDRKIVLQLQLEALDRELGDTKEEIALHEFNVSQASRMNRRYPDYQKQRYEQARVTKDLLTERRTPLLKEIEELDKLLGVKKVRVKLPDTGEKIQIEVKKKAVKKKKKGKGIQVIGEGEEKIELESIPKDEETGSFFKIADIQGIEKKGYTKKGDFGYIKKGTDDELEIEIEEPKIKIVEPKKTLSDILDEITSAVNVEDQMKAQKDLFKEVSRLSDERKAEEKKKKSKDRGSTGSFTKLLLKEKQPEGYVIVDKGYTDKFLKKKGEVKLGKEKLFEDFDDAFEESAELFQKQVKTIQKYAKDPNAPAKELLKTLPEYEVKKVRIRFNKKEGPELQFLKDK